MYKNFQLKFTILETIQTININITPFIILSIRKHQLILHKILFKLIFSPFCLRCLCRNFLLTVFYLSLKFSWRELCVCSLIFIIKWLEWNGALSTILIHLAINSNTIEFELELSQLYFMKLETHYTTTIPKNDQMVLYTRCLFHCIGFCREMITIVNERIKFDCMKISIK